MARPSVCTALLLLAALGCTPDAPPVGAPPPPSGVDAEAVSGTYDVHGVTVQALTGRQREIGGSVELDVERGRYEVSFELETTDPDSAQRVPVRVRGSGRGFVVGGIFTGTTEEWMALDVPMDEATSVALPTNAGRKIVSSSQASFDADGAFQIVLQNYAGAGEGYHPSVTVLSGRRVEPAAAP